MIVQSSNPSILKRITEDTYIVLFTEPVTGIPNSSWKLKVIYCWQNNNSNPVLKVGWENYILLYEL